MSSIFTYPFLKHTGKRFALGQAPSGPTKLVNVNQLVNNMNSFKIQCNLLVMVSLVEMYAF